MFDSPIAYCPKCNQMVLVDQTQRECKAEHECGDIECPLRQYFSGYDFSRPVDEKKERHHGSG